MPAVNRIVGVLAAALATGLSAHLLSESIWHHGSVRDVVLLVAAFCLLRFTSKRSMTGTGIVLAVSIGAAAVAAFWPMLEPGAHEFGIQTLLSLVWLIPVLLTFIVSAYMLARESLDLMRAIVAMIGFEQTLRPIAAFLRIPNRERIILYDRWCDVISRRGPPMPVLIVNRST